MTKEGYVPAIWRPSRQVRQHRRKNELQLLRSVDLASPHRAIRRIVISDPLTVTREVKTHGGDSRKVRRVVSGFGIIAEQFSAGPPTLDK